MPGKRHLASVETLRRRSLGRVLVAALALVVLLVGIQLISGFPAIDQAEPRTENINTTIQMLVVGCLVAVWGFSVKVRCSDAAIRRYLIIIAAIFVLWLLDVIIKYASEDDLLGSLYWYFFYIPFLFTPTLCLFSSLHAAALDRAPLVRMVKLFVVVLDIVLILFVFTNNIHYGVFVFSFDDPLWSDNYSYAWGYWLIFAWCILQFIAFIITLFAAARRQLRSALLPVLVITIVGITYSLLYALRIGNVMSTNLTLAYVIAVTLALEACLDLGLLPSHVRYGEAFSRLPFDVKILDYDFNTVFQTDCATPLSPGLRAALEKNSVGKKGSLSFKIPEEPTTLFKIFSIAGGTVLFANDVSEIVKRRGQLEQRRDALRRRNLMLERNRMVRAKLYRQKLEGELFDELDHSLKRETLRIKEILDSLPSGEDEQSLSERRRQLAIVKLLIAYCKRKGSLVLDKKGDPEFDRSRLQLIVNETSADLRAAGIDCAAIVDVDKAVPSAAANVLYDCLCDFSIESFSYDNPALMIYIHDKDARSIEMKIVMEKEHTGQVRDASLLVKLQKILETRDVVFRLEDSEDRVKLSIVVFREGL